VKYCVVDSIDDILVDLVRFTADTAHAAEWVAEPDLPPNGQRLLVLEVDDGAGFVARTWGR